MELKKVFEFLFIELFIDVHIFGTIRPIYVISIQNFRNFCLKIRQILQKYVKIFTKSVVNLIFQDKKKIVDYFDLTTLAKMAKYFKIQPFSAKVARNKTL